MIDPSTVTITSAPHHPECYRHSTPAPSSNSKRSKSTTWKHPQTTPSSGAPVRPSRSSPVPKSFFAANGTKANVWFLHGLTDPVLYFRAYGSSAGTAQGPFSAIFGPTTIGAPTGGNTVSGAISFSQPPAGPLYVGFLSQTNGNFYAQYIPSPASAQPYSIQVPSDLYDFFAILDQNNDGLIDAGDIQNATDSTSANNQTVAVSGPQSNLNLTLPSANVTASVTTQNYNSISPGNNFHSYSLNLQVAGLVKPVVAVTMTSGPNLINPVDIALCGEPDSSCGNGFQANFAIGATVPTVGDTYAFNVTYSDGNTGTVNAVVSAVLNTFATSLAPQTGTSVSVTPTFSWTDPTNASNYTYQFSLSDSNNNNIWQIPGNNSNLNGFTSTITSIPWITSGNDVTGASGNLPSVGSLTLGSVYTWSSQVRDNVGNTAQTQVQYQP